jgi:hypothetical protein
LVVVAGACAISDDIIAAIHKKWFIVFVHRIIHEIAPADAD